MCRRRRYRWSAVIIGTESGRRTRTTFVLFHTHEQAQAWCAEMNAKQDGDLTRWEPEPLTRGD